MIDRTGSGAVIGGGMRLLLIGLCLLSAAATGASAQGAPGMPGGTVGLPANPFASNYPSAPPALEPSRGPRREGHVLRRRVDGARRLPPDGPIPPAAIPGR